MKKGDTSRARRRLQLIAHHSAEMLPWHLQQFGWKKFTLPEELRIEDWSFLEPQPISCFHWETVQGGVLGMRPVFPEDAVEWVSALARPFYGAM
jgi:hypothetical protein